MQKTIQKEIQKEIDEKDYYASNDYGTNYWNMKQGAKLKAKILCETESYPIGTKIQLLYNGLGKVMAKKVNHFQVDLIFIGYDKKRKIRSGICDCDVDLVIDEVQKL